MDKSAKKSISREITFLSDGYKLKGNLHMPATERPPVVIGSHGLFSSRNSPKQIALAHQCNRLNIAFLRFDHRGCGESQGAFEKVTSLEARCQDLIHAINLINASGETDDRIGLFGSSMGGAVCLCVASKIKIATLVTVAAPIRSRQIRNAIERPEALNHQNMRFDAKKNAFDISDRLINIRNILMFHGEADTIVPMSHAREIFQRVGDPKKLMIQKGGDHRMSNINHQNIFIREASLWFKSRLIDGP
jgi:alpha-beta hydrolase superfamily lysophospholipase